MCGIAGVYLRDPKLSVDLDGLLDTMLDKIEHRGGDATGYVALDAKGVAEWHRAGCDSRDFKKYRRLVPEGTRILMAHTRWATQGLPAFMENNHPIRRGSFYVIHNGHVSNDQELFKLADRVPFGQCDSESIPARIASLGTLDKVPQVMEEIVGAAAIAAVDAENPRRLVLARGVSSPLHVLVTDKIVLWGSTQDTVKVAYKKHVGRLPKRTKIESVPEGTAIFVNSRTVTRTEFEVWRPKPLPKEAYKVWQDDTEDGACSVPVAHPLPAHSGMPTVGGWPKWDEDGHVISDEDADKRELVECDVCSTWIKWSDAQFEPDPGSDFSWTLCDRCKDVDLEGVDFHSFGFASEDIAEVNAAILDEDDS